MPVNYKPETDRAREPEFTPSAAPARTGGTAGEPQLQTRRAKHAVVAHSRNMGLTRLLGVILILAALSTRVQALSSVTLTWTPSTDPTVVGCNLYYGVASRTYTNMVNPGTATNATISNLTDGTTYFFAATSYNLLGMESDFSDEAIYTVPGVAPGAQANLQIRVAPTRQVILTVTGQAGHTYNLQASSDLITWTGIGTLLMPAEGSLAMTDTNAASFPKRFYRTQ